MKRCDFFNMFDNKRGINLAIILKRRRVAQAKGQPFQRRCRILFPLEIVRRGLD
jgi:hypothetical protein